jgi:hypothetical protein
MAKTVTGDKEFNDLLENWSEIAKISDESDEYASYYKSLRDLIEERRIFSSPWKDPESGESSFGNAPKGLAEFDSVFSILPRAIQERIAHDLLTGKRIDRYITPGSPRMRRLLLALDKARIIDGTIPGSRSAIADVRFALEEALVRKRASAAAAGRRKSSAEAIAATVANDLLKGKHKTVRGKIKLNPQKTIDRLLSEAMGAMKIRGNAAQRNAFLGAFGRGPLGKTEFISRGLNRSLERLISQRGFAGLEAAAQVISLIAGASSEGIRFDANGRPTNIRKIFSGPNASKIPGEIKSLIQKDLPVLLRETEEILRKDPKASASKAIATALARSRAGQIKRAKVKGRSSAGKLSSSKMFVSARAPIHVGESEKAIEKFASELALNAKDGLVGAILSAFVNAPKGAAAKRERLARHEKAAGIREAKKAAKSAKIENLAKKIHGPLESLMGRNTHKGEAPQNVLDAFKQFRDDVESSYKDAQKQGAVGHKTLIKAGTYENLQERIGYFKELQKVFKSPAWTSLPKPAKNQVLLAVGMTLGASGQELIKFVSSVNDAKGAVRKLTGSDKERQLAVRALTGDSEARGLASVLERSSKVLKAGSIQYRRPMSILSDEEIASRIKAKMIGRVDAYKKQTRKFYSALKRNPAGITHADVLLSGEATINRAQGIKATPGARALVISSALKAEKDLVFKNANTIWDNYHNAVLAVNGRPTFENYQAALRAGRIYNDTIGSYELLYRSLGGPAGTFVEGNRKQIEKASYKGILATRGYDQDALGWLAQNPEFMNSFGDPSVAKRNLPGKWLESDGFKDESRAVQKFAEAKSKALIDRDEAREKFWSAKKTFWENDPKYKALGKELDALSPQIGQARLAAQDAHKEWKAKSGPIRERIAKLDPQKKQDRNKIKQLNNELYALERNKDLKDRHVRNLEKREGTIRLTQNNMFEGTAEGRRLKSIAEKATKKYESITVSKFAKYATIYDRVPKIGGTKFRARGAYGKIERLAVLLSGEGAKYGLLGTAEAAMLQKVVAPHIGQATTGSAASANLEAAVQALAKAAADLAKGVRPDERARGERAVARESKAAAATKPKVEKAAETIAEAASDAVAKAAKGTGRTRAAATKVEQAAVVTVAPAAGGGGGGRGGGRRRTAVSPSGDQGPIPPIGGKNIENIRNSARGVADMFGALQSIAPVSQKKLNDIKASVRGISEMMAELKAVSGGKISAKGLAAAITNQAGRAGAVAAVGGKGGGGGGAGGGGGTQRLIGYSLPGSQDLREQEQNINRFTQKTEGILGRFLDQIKFGFSQQIVGQISQGVGALLAHLQGGIIGFNAQLENSTVAFQTLFENEQVAMGAMSIDIGKAEDQANVLVSSIQQFANITPFRFPELVESARRMRAFGFETEEIMPNLQAIGDAVAALGGEDDKLNRITYALGQMKQSGRVYQNDMMQLANAGIAGYELLSKAVIKDMVKTGEASVKYLGQVIDKGSLRGDDGARMLNLLNTAANRVTKFATKYGVEGIKRSGVEIKALAGARSIVQETVNLILSQGPVQAMRTLSKRGKIEGGAAARAILAEMAAQFRGGMEKLSKTFKGALSTLQDTSQYMVALITKPIYEGIRDVMYDVGLFFQSRAARKMAADFAASFAEVLPALGSSLNDISTIISKFVQGVTELISKFVGFSSTFGEAGNILAIFGDGVNAIAEMMRNKMVRSAVVAAAAIKVLSMAFNANPMLIAISGAIAAIGLLSRFYDNNDFGVRDVVNEFVGPMQGIVANIRSNILPLLAEVAKGMSGVFSATLISTINLALPVLNAFLKVLNLILEALNKVPVVSNIAGVALAAVFAGKLAKGLVLGSGPKFDPQGNMIKAASGGLLGSYQRFIGGATAGMGGTVARQDMFQQAFKSTQKAKSVAGVVRAQTTAAKSVIERAVASRALTRAQGDNALAVFADKLKSIVGTAKNASEAKAAVARGGELGAIVKASINTAKITASTSGTAVGVRMADAAKDTKIAASGLVAGAKGFLSGVQKFVGAIARLPQALASVAAGGTFFSGPAFAGSQWAKLGVAGTAAARFRATAAQGLGLNARAASGLSGLQIGKGVLTSGLKSMGKIGGFFSLLGVGADLAAGVDPTRAVMRGGGGFLGGALGGAAAGSIFGPVGTLVGAIGGGLLGSGLGDALATLIGIKQETSEIVQDLTEADIKTQLWNNALKDNKLTFQEFGSISDQITVTVEDVAAALKSATGEDTLTPESAIRQIASGLQISDLTKPLEALDMLKPAVQKYYENKFMNEAPTGTAPIYGKTGQVANKELYEKAQLFAQADIINSIVQQGTITSVDQLNQLLQTLSTKFGMSGDAAAAFNLLIGGTAGEVEGLNTALEAANNKLSWLQTRFGLVQSALQNRIMAVFEKKFAEELEKAKDAFLATQEVIVEGTTWNLLALRKEIEEQEKKNRLLEIEKSLREANRNIEMARLSQYDASIDPLEAAARMREAEEAKTEAVKKASLERKQIALDEAMMSTPVKDGLKEIDEKFEALRMKFQEGMAKIMALLEAGKISGSEAIEKIKELYTASWEEMGVLDANLDADAAEFGDSFLGTWDTIIDKFEKLGNKLEKLLKKIKQLAKAIKDVGDGKSDGTEEEDPGTDAPPGPSRPPGDWSTMPGGRAGDNWRGWGMDPAEIAAMKKAVADAQKKNVAIRFANMMKVLQNAQMPKNLTFSQQVGWPMAISRALASFSYGGNMYDLFTRSQKTNDPIAVMKQFNAGKKAIDQIFFPYGNKNPVAGMASGGTVMGPGTFKVGEAGTEVMQVTPFGVARVFPRTYRPINGISAAGHSSGGAVNASVIINNPTVRNDQDIRKLAEEVSRAQRSLLRSSGVGRI